jgi:hypothetical protein
VTFAVIALFVVDDVNTPFDTNGDVRALGLAGVATGAGSGIDLVSHGDTP